MIASLLLDDTMRPSLIKGSLSEMVFRCCCNHTTRCKSSCIVDLDIIVLKENICVPFQSVTHLQVFVAGLQISVRFPLDAIRYLVKCLLPHPTLVPLRRVCHHFLSPSSLERTMYLFFTIAFFFHFLLSTAVSNLLVRCLVKHLLMRSSSLKSQLLKNTREEVNFNIVLYFVLSVF